MLNESRAGRIVNKGADAGPQKGDAQRFTLVLHEPLADDHGDHGRGGERQTDTDNDGAYINVPLALGEGQTEPASGHAEHADGGDDAGLDHLEKLGEPAE